MHEVYRIVGYKPKYSFLLYLGFYNVENDFTNGNGGFIEDMKVGISFFITNIMLGVGLAMDAFSVSMVNGLNEPSMRKRKMAMIAGVFGIFQFAMPLIGWVCVSTIAHLFQVFEQFIPWIALILLGFIGGKMFYEGITQKEDVEEKGAVGVYGLFIQGIATSIDALSVGFTIADYGVLEALFASMLIGVVTFFICYVGLGIGKKAGTRLSGKAEIVGGIILICIGLEIFVTSDVVTVFLSF